MRGLKDASIRGNSDECSLFARDEGHLCVHALVLSALTAQIQIIKIPEQLDQNVIQLVEMDSQAPVAPAPTYSVRQKEPEIEPPVGNVSEHF